MLAPHGYALTISAVGRDPHVVVAEPAEEDRLRTARRRPLDGALLEVVKPPTPVRSPRFIRGRIAEEATVAAELCPFYANTSMHLVRAGLRREVDRAVLVVARAATAVAQ